MAIAGSENGENTDLRERDILRSAAGMPITRFDTREADI